MKVGIFGATGMVGQELLKVLFDRKFPMNSLRLYAGQSAGTKVETPTGEITVENANTADYSELELAFLQLEKDGQKKMLQRQLKLDVM